MTDNRCFEKLPVIELVLLEPVFVLLLMQLKTYLIQANREKTTKEKATPFIKSNNEVFRLNEIDRT